MPATTLFATYVAELGAPLRREGYKTVSLSAAEQRLKRLAAARQARGADLHSLEGSEVRVILPSGAERLYAVVTCDHSGNLHLRDVEGGDKILQ